MKTFFIIAGGLIGVLLLTAGIGWLSAGNDFLMFRFFAPRQEAVRRETFEQSKAFNQGMVQELDAMFQEYAKAGPDQKAALRSIVLHRVADYPVDQLPDYLRAWVSSLRTSSTSI